MRAASEVEQIERFFVLHIDSVAPPVHNSSPEDNVEHRWWPRCELAATHETIYPEGFLERLNLLL